MAEQLIFQFQSGTSVLHRIDIRVKLAGMIIFSLLLIKVSLFRLLFLLPLLLNLQWSVRQHRISLPFLLYLMPALIFIGNLTSLLLGPSGVFEAIMTAAMKMLAFVTILWMAQLFTMSSDPLLITPAFYSLLRHIPLIPAGQISTQMGLSLALVPLILDEMKEIKDAMTSRCGWTRHRPLRNLIHIGLPLLNGVLTKAEALSDAMESRLFTEEATGPEISPASQSQYSLIVLLLIVILLLSAEFLLMNFADIPVLNTFY